MELSVTQLVAGDGGTDFAFLFSAVKERRWVEGSLATDGESDSRLSLLVRAFGLEDCSLRFWACWQSCW